MKSSLYKLIVWKYLYLVVFVVLFYFSSFESLYFLNFYSFSLQCKVVSCFKKYLNKFNISIGVMGLYLTISLCGNRDYKLAWWLCYHGTYLPSLVYGSIFITALRRRSKDYRFLLSFGMLYVFWAFLPPKFFPWAQLAYRCSAVDIHHNLALLFRPYGLKFK